MKEIASKRELLYLGQILKRDKIKYGRNNLIISPTGSGKTHFMINELGNRSEGKKLMLVSVTALKDSLLNHDKIFSTKDLRCEAIKADPDNFHVMTYAEFGRRIFHNDDFIDSYGIIFCDEIHSLFHYFMMKQSNELAIVIKYLFGGKSELEIFQFTATTDKLDAYRDRANKDLYKYVNTINYKDDEDIMRYEVEIELEFSNMEELEKSFDKFSEYDLVKKKGLAFSERITGMKKIEEALESKGYSSICIWSINNEDVEMNEEQLRVREILLKDGVIPDEYDFIIINEAMREGWNLVDTRVEIAILDTKDVTNAIQALGRTRKDIKLCLVRSSEEIKTVDMMIMERESSIGVIEQFLGKLIGKGEKELICERLNIRLDVNGRLVKWPTIMKTLIANGYIIKNSKKTVNGVRGTYTVITKAPNSSSTRTGSSSPTTMFIQKLDRLGFREVNSDFLANYMKLGKNVAYKHIIGSYENFVVKEGWSERKLADITYLLANNKLAFSKDNYTDYGSRYVNIDDDLMLEIRSKYEIKAKNQIDVKSAQKLAKQKLEEDEILEYIANNGGNRNQ